jgi:hypothetical protein
MVIVTDLVMDPASATSASAGSATETHTTARIGCVTVNSNTATAGTMGAKVGFDSDNEDKVLIFGKLPEKYDVFGSIDTAGLEDSAMKVVGMTIDFTTSSYVDTTANYFAITEFDHKLDNTTATLNGYTKTEMQRICWNGPNHDTTSTAATQEWFIKIDADTDGSTGTDKNPLGSDNYADIDFVGGPTYTNLGDYGFGTNGVIGYFRPDTATTNHSVDLSAWIKSKSLDWGDYFSFAIQKMNNSTISNDFTTFQQTNAASVQRKTINVSSGDGHETGIDLIIHYEDPAPARPVTTLSADTDMINAVATFKTKPKETDIKEFRTVWKANYDSTSDATIETSADTINGIKGVTYSTSTTYSAATSDLGKETLKQADGDITSTFLALEGTDSTYAMCVYASDQNSNTMGNLMTHYRLRGEGAVASSSPAIGEEVTLTVAGYSHSSSSTAANFSKFGVNWNGGATATNDSLDDYSIITLDAPATTATIKHVFDKADSTTYVNIFVVDSLGFRSNFKRATTVNVGESNPVAVLRASRDTAVRAKYGDEFSVINLSLSHSYPIGSDRIIMGYQFKHNSDNPITTHPMTNDNSNFNDASTSIKLKCINLENVGTASSGTEILVFGKVAVDSAGAPVADTLALFDHYEQQVHTVKPHLTNLDAYGDAPAVDGTAVQYKSVDFVIIKQLDPQDSAARSGRYVLADADGNIINDKICGMKDTYEWGGHRDLTDNMTTQNISTSDTITKTGSGTFIINGAMIGDKIYLAQPEDAANNGFYTLSDVAAAVLDTNEDIPTGNTDDTSVEIYKVNGPTLPIASYAGGYAPTITARVISTTSATSTSDELDNSTEVTQVIRFESEEYNTLDLDTQADAGHISIQNASIKRSGGMSTRMPLGGRRYPIGTTRTSMGEPSVSLTVRALTQTGYKQLWSLIEGDRYEWTTIDSKQIDAPGTAYKQLRMRLTSGSINKDPDMASQYTASLEFTVIGELVA